MILRHGYGIHTWADGEKYMGQWCKDIREGKGMYICKDGKINMGEFKDNKFVK